MKSTIVHLLLFLQRWSAAFTIGFLLAILITTYLSANRSTSANFSHNSYASIIQSASPAVVSIYSTSTVEQTYRPLLNDPFFNKQLNERFLPSRQTTQSNLGSGVIIYNEGYILTNLHVIADASEIIVALADGREAQAKVVGINQSIDLAVLKIEMASLKSIQLNRDNNAQVGDIVFSIGNPFNVGQSASMGILSAKGRQQLGLSSFEHYLQTDAAINPGSSGGALINVEGKMIGLSTALISNSGGNQGLGFAIPTEIAMQLADQIIEQHNILNAFLGFEQFNIISPITANKLGLNFQALQLLQLDRDAIGWQTGLRAGDILLRVDEKIITKAGDLSDYLTQLPSQQKINLTILRQQQLINVMLTISEQ